MNDKSYSIIYYYNLYSHLSTLILIWVDHLLLSFRRSFHLRASGTFLPHLRWCHVSPPIPMLWQLGPLEVAPLPRPNPGTSSWQFRQQIFKIGDMMICSIGLCWVTAYARIRCSKWIQIPKNKALTKAPMPLKSAASRLFDQPGPRQVSSLVIHFASCHLASETVTEGGVATSTMAIWATVSWSLERSIASTRWIFVKYRWKLCSLMIAVQCQLAYGSGACAAGALEATGIITAVKSLSRLC